MSSLSGRFVAGSAASGIPRPLAGGVPFFRPDMLMIGATGRNAGKTELACRLIRSHASRMPIVALKVTTVARAEGSCPHGGEGCGTCSSLGEETWCVTRELDAGSDKDTSRLLRGGAREVWWLRVHEEALAEGAAGLLSHVPAARVSVCESNRLRRVVEPGLFLQVRSEGERTAKPSARSVAGLADLVVVSDGASFDLELERISLLDGQWALRRDACAVVVAAEQSPPRAAAIEPLLASLRAQFTEVAADAVPAGPNDDRGFLSTLVAALARSSHDWCLIVPSNRGRVDAGLVNALFRRREDVDAVVVREASGESRLPIGLYHRDLLARVLRADPSRTPGLAALGPVRELALAEDE